MGEKNIANGGWNRPQDAGCGRAAKRRMSTPSKLRGICAGAMAAAVAFVGVWYALRNGGDAKTPRRNLRNGKVIAETKSNIQSHGVPDAKTSSVDAGTRKASFDKTTSPAAETGQAVADVDELEAGKDVKPKHKVVFANPMDQLLSMVTPHEAGGSVPPVPISDDMEFTPEQENQMFEQLVVSDDDSNEVLERKELVQALRNEYVELKKNRGWKFVDYIKALEAKAKLDNEILTESWKIHETVFNDPNISDEKYYETLQTINKVLGDRGIKPISPLDDDDDGSAEPSANRKTSQETAK